MLATTGTLPADDSRWAFEIKWDGVRAITYAGGGALRMESRNLLDITPRYPELHGLADAFGGRGAVLDGEVVTFDERGRPSFGLLQHRMHVSGEAEVRRRMAQYPAVYMVFDVLWLDGESLVGEPYEVRRAALLDLDLGSGSWKAPSHHIGDGAAMSAASKEQGLEGVMAKKLGSVYEPGRRSRCWIKIKNTARQEVVIGGWLPGEGNRSGRLGALLVGVHEAGGLRFSGKVGTGFTDRGLDELGARLAPIEQPSSPFATKVPYRNARFVRPELVCDVEFTEWTANGTLRHPSYKGLRDDKRPDEVVREPSPGDPPG
jgi:bifunctional non-homologous end joining protein LigD